MDKKYLIAGAIFLLVVSLGFKFSSEFSSLHMLQSPGAEVADYVEPDYGLGDGHIDKLIPYPNVKKGERTPFDLWLYGGKGKTSFMNPNLPMDWEDWVKFNKEQKPQLMADVRAYMASRYDFSGATIPGAMMSGQRKPVMMGPIARLPKGIASFEALAAMSPDEIKEKICFLINRWPTPCNQPPTWCFPTTGTRYIPSTSGWIWITISLMGTFLNFHRPCS
jgi:hypothetical protein